jgi:hypothetical protein
MNNLKIIVSTALVSQYDLPVSHHDQNFDLTIDERYREYEECLNIIKSFGYDFIIMETVSEHDLFLENFGKVIYTNVNNRSFKNRGSNYINAMKNALDTLEFEDDDLIIHITGRYPLVDNTFIERCKVIESDGCFGKDYLGQFYLFLYALRYKKLKKLLNSIDVEYFDSSGVNLERVFSEFLENDNLDFVDKLGIIGRQSNSPKSIYGQTIF